MSHLMPIISQKDLDSISLTRTSSGIALKAFHASWNTEVSVKLLSHWDAGERDFKVLLQEAASTRSFQGEQLLPLLGICQFQGFLGVLTKWMHNGSLGLLIHEHDLYPKLPFALCVRILSDVATGLSYLHNLEPPVLHHSLKPSNILLDLEYRAKISDFGQPTWRRKHLRTILQNCDSQRCWDLLALSPEILERGSFSQEGDIYSFGMTCWELFSRQKPLKEKKTLLEAVTGICSGLRPGVEPAFIPEDLPYRNKLVRLILLCWHQDPGYRPSAAECSTFLKDILGTFRKEVISDAVYNLVHAKECAINAAKGPFTHLLETAICNLEVICPQNNNVPNKKVRLEAQSLSQGRESPGNNVNQRILASDIPQDPALERDLHVRVSPSCSSPASLTSDSRTSNNKSFCSESKDHRQPFPQTLREPDHPPYKDCRNHWPESALIGPGGKERNCTLCVPGPGGKERNCTLLACGRETILSSMTEGRLNHLLDVLRSQRLLSRADYETITSLPTLTSRTRTLIDTCLGLGEKAAEVVVAVLASRKGSLLVQRLLTNEVN